MRSVPVCLRVRACHGIMVCVGSWTPCPFATDNVRSLARSARCRCWCWWQCWPSSDCTLDSLFLSSLPFGSVAGCCCHSSSRSPAVPVVSLGFQGLAWLYLHLPTRNLERLAEPKPKRDKPWLCWQHPFVACFIFPAIHFFVFAERSREPRTAERMKE